MPVFRYLLFLTFIVLINSTAVSAQFAKKILQTQTDSINLFDKSRNRLVPVALYFPVLKNQGKGQKLVIFSHGYYQNMPGGNIKYSYLTESLAANGYFVASIQHELPTDELIPTSGIPQIVRRPFWDRGADNILFVINTLKKSNPNLDFSDITLIGHSNGGDMTALFPQKYPDVITRIITLDNRRMALPRSKHLKVYSLRSSDQPADEGVLPTPEEKGNFNFVILKLPGTIHNDMDNRGTTAQKSEITGYILKFLTDQIN